MLPTSVPALLLHLLLSLSSATADSRMAELRRRLLEQYDSECRPVRSVNNTVHIDVGMSIMRIVEINEQKQVMVSNVQLMLRWTDEFLQWDATIPAEEVLLFSPQEIWTPDIVLFNAAEDFSVHKRDGYMIRVHHSGEITWTFPETLHSFCRIDYANIPFDEQSCWLEIQSWSRKMPEVNISELFSQLALPKTHKMQTEWDLLKVTVERREDNSFAYLQYVLELRRKRSFYIYNFVLPFSMISALTAFVFWLPPDSGEKLTLTVTILLSLVVCLQYVASMTPRSAQSLPLISWYFNAHLLVVLLSVVLAVGVLHFHYRDPAAHRMPMIVRKVFINGMGTLLLIDRRWGLKDTAVLKRLKARTDDCLRTIETETNADEQARVLIQVLATFSRWLAEERGVEDWKILASVLDRVFFIIYIILMPSLTLILFWRFDSV